MRSVSALVLVAGATAVAWGQDTTVILDDFESFADTAALRVVNTSGGPASISVNWDGLLIDGAVPVEVQRFTVD